MYKRTKVGKAAFNALPRIAYLSVLTLLVAIAVISNAEGAEWRIEPVIRIAADIDDNPFLSIRTDTEEDASGYIVEGAANIAYTADRTNFSILPVLRSRAYDEELNLDSDDQFLNMRFNTRTLSTEFGFRANYSRESTRTAERADTDFDIEDPTEIIEDDSGRVGIRDRRERLILTPSVRYQLSNVSNLNARVDYQDVDYDDVFEGIYTDYTDTRLNLSYSRAFSARNTGILAATYRSYDTGDDSESVDGVGFNLGFERRISETTQIRATAGLEDTELIGADSEIAWVADVSLSRQLETINLFAQYRRSVAASGTGQLGARDSINFNFTRDLNDKITAGIGARVYVINPLIDTGQVFDEQDYVQLRSQLVWNVSEVFSVEANYRYTFLDRDLLGEASNSNQITIWLNYRPRPVIRSR
ncbi:MAG: hypothetical protein ACR2Q3_15935 [Woeseiaceae bacterium]